MLTTFDSLFDLMEAFPDEQACIDHLRAIRWKDGEFCPHCGSTRLYAFSDRKTWKCADCHARFSIKVGTIFHDTKLPLRKWFMAIWMITNHPKGVASTTLAKDLKITQKSAWFMLHRLRHASRTKSFNAPMTGDVEIDETLIGGKSRNKHASKRTGSRKGKSVVIDAVERGGALVTKVLPVASQPELQGFVHKTVAPSATLLATDRHGAYKSLTGYPTHQMVNHSAGQHRSGDAHTNTIDGVWALLKRQIYGVHHWVSPKHLAQYVGEMTFRFNRREATVTDRMNDLFGHVEGRLTYKALIA